MDKKEFFAIVSLLTQFIEAADKHTDTAENPTLLIHHEPKTYIPGGTSNGNQS
jgi:hypothetical protein